MFSVIAVIELCVFFPLTETHAPAHPLYSSPLIALFFFPSLNVRTHTHATPHSAFTPQAALHQPL